MTCGPTYMTARVVLSQAERAALPTAQDFERWCERHGILLGLATEVRWQEDAATGAYHYEIDLTTPEAAYAFDQRRQYALWKWREGRV